MSVQLHQSFRFQRLSKTNQVRKLSISQLSSHDTLKLAAYNSIFHGVKYNDVSFVTPPQLKKLRKQPQISMNLQHESVVENMKAIRLKYDQIHTKCVNYQAKIKLLNEEIVKYKIYQQQLSHNQTHGKSSLATLSQKLNQIKYDFISSDMNRKILLHMVDRHKKDKVVYDQIQFNYKQQLRFLKTQLDIIKGDCKGVYQQGDRAKKLTEKLIKQLKIENDQRAQHIQNIQKLIQNKRKVIEGNELRGSQILEIASRAMLEKDGNQKNWNKLLLAQSFLEKLLKDKMESQMKKFHVVESAFKHIKISTGVSDVSVMVQKYLNKQLAYGQLLGKIAENQKKIEQLKQQAKQLQKEQRKLEQEQKQLLEIRRKQTINMEKQQKLLEFHQNRKKNIELKQNNMKMWAIKNIKKFKLLGQKIQKVPLSNDVGNLTAVFKTYLNAILYNLQSIQQDKLTNQPIKVSQVNQKNADLLFRVKVMNRRKNSMSEQIINPEFQEEEVTNLVQQEQNITANRAEVLKNNEKFMAQLKSKYQEIKRLKLQAEPKKKQKEIQKPKKIIDQQ